MFRDGNDLSPNCYNDEIEKSKSDEFIVVWSNLYYRLYPSKFSQWVERLKGHRQLTGYKTVLRNCSGTLRSGRLTAIMGPSGAGKSTLIECLIGLKVNNVEGEIRLIGLPSKISISYLPQEDQLYDFLSVRESITFSYKLKAIAKGQPADNNIRIKNLVDRLVGQLDLVSCVGQWVKNLSGGQKKRVSIAQELVSSPDILVLDEPSSGLDSSACYSLIKLLRSITEQLSIIIAVTVHQPSARTFNLFQDVYILSSNGRIMFTGEPSQVIPTLSSVGIVIEPLNNPVDVLIEVASGDYGYEIIDQLVQKAEKKTAKDEILCGGARGKRLADSVTPYQGSFFKATNFLTQRGLLNIYRNRKFHSVRGMIVFSILIMVGYIYKEVGIYDGCVSSKMVDDVKSGKLNSVRQDLDKMLWDSLKNVSSIYMIILCIAFTNLLTPCSRLPMEMPLFKKEYFNKWFSAGSYFMAQLLADLPICFLSLIAIFVGHFYFTAQPIDRCLKVFFLFTMLTNISYVSGLIVAIICMDNLYAAIFAGFNVGMLTSFLSGFNFRVADMSPFLQTISNLSFIRLVFEGAAVAILGFKRCEYGKEFLRSMAESGKQLELFVNSMFNIALNSIDQLGNPSETKILSNQVQSVTQEIVMSLDLQHFPKDGTSIGLKNLNLTDDGYVLSIWKLTGFTLLLIVLTIAAIKYRSRITE